MKNKMSGIKVKYIYSACIVTETPDVSVLHDPWFTEGIYDGAWYHFPKVEDPMVSIGNVDLIYISHIHPDHYDPYFLKKYFKKYGKKKIIIADHMPNFLAGKMRADGIEFSVLSNVMHIGNTSITVVPHKTNSISDVDSAIVIKYKSRSGKSHCIINANDIVFDDDMGDKLKCISGDVDIFLCGYTGAGPYPQTYFEISDPQLKEEALKKKYAFFDRYKKITNKIDAKINIPFAGKYLLGGKNAILNDHRGVADPVEILDIDDKAVVLSDDGGWIDTKNFKASAVRLKRYDDKELAERIDEIKEIKMNYERLIAVDEIWQLPLKRLLISAAKNAVIKSECETDYFFCIRLLNDEIAVINANRLNGGVVFMNSSKDLPEPRTEIFIDMRYLFGLLTHVYHWNNAEVGSQFHSRRYPNVFNRKTQSFLNFLAV